MSNPSKYYKLEKSFLGLKVFMKKDCFGYYIIQVYDYYPYVGTGSHKNKFTAFRKALISLRFDRLR